MEKFFKLRENNTTVGTEIMAGLTTFMTMAYILIVNPNTLAVAGMDWQAVFLATALAAIVGTVCMALFTNYPFALAPGMGLNAFFAYTVVDIMGYDWRVALFAVFIEGLIFVVLTAVNIREAIFDAIPLNLKYAVSAGIGLFIAFIGLQTSKIVVSNADTLVQINPELASTVPAILTFVGVLITGILVAKKVKGAVLYGILATWVIGIICQLAGIYEVNPAIGQFSVIPNKIISLDFSIGPVFGKAFDLGDLGGIGAVLTDLNFWVVVFSFLFVDLFDTLGTLIGVSSKAGYLDKDGKLPKAKGALFADAIATTVGAALGTSTTTTYVESASGVQVGGRTGLTGLTVAGLFFIALFFSPVFMAIPAFATAPALIIVGFYMMESVGKIAFDKPTEGIPAFLTIVVMPMTYSISEGIVAGFISYTVINLVTGKKNKVSWLMIGISIVFVLKYIFI